MKFNEILKELREDRDINKISLSKAIKVSRQLITAFENGSSLPNIETLREIADYFGVSADYLLGREEYITLQKDKKRKYIFLPDDLSEEDCSLIKDFTVMLYKRNLLKKK